MIKKSPALSEPMRKLLAKATKRWAPLPNGMKRPSRTLDALCDRGYAQVGFNGIWRFRRTTSAPDVGSVTLPWRR